MPKKAGQEKDARKQRTENQHIKIIIFNTNETEKPE
jgi:hypothetical protein